MQKNITLIIALIVCNFYYANAQFSNDNKWAKPKQQEYLLVKDSLYFGKYEVSYYEYLAFLGELKLSGKSDLYELYKIDSLEVDSLFKKTNYGFEQEYSIVNFPVSNITYDAAVEFCKWKTNRYNNDKKRKFNKVLFRLPTESEWEFAARGVYRDFPYPWGPYLRDKNGRYLCNFNRVGGERITFNPTSKKYEVVNEDDYYDPIRFNRISMICTINHFKPNYYGLYNIVGNVAEMVAEKGLAKGGGFRDPGYDIRIKSKKTFSKPSDDIGFRVVMVLVEKSEFK